MRRSASEIIRELEMRVARLERQASSVGLQIIHEKIDEICEKHLSRNQGEIFEYENPLGEGGTKRFGRNVDQDFLLDLSAMELEEVTKYFNKNANRNTVIFNDDKQVNAIVGKHLDNSKYLQYFVPKSARSAGGTPFCVLKQDRRGFVLNIQFSTILEKPMHGPSKKPPHYDLIMDMKKTFKR